MEALQNFNLRHRHAQFFVENWEPLIFLRVRRFKSGKWECKLTYRSSFWTRATTCSTCADLLNLFTSFGIALYVDAPQSDFRANFFDLQTDLEIRYADFNQNISMFS